SNGARSIRPPDSAKERTPMAFESLQTPQVPRTKRPKSRLRQILVGALAVAILLTCFLAYLNRELIGSVLFGSHFVRGDPSVAAPPLPAGFTASVFASGLNSPRFLTFGPDGNLYVANRGANEVVAFSLTGTTGGASRRVVIAGGLDDPTSLTF